MHLETVFVTFVIIMILFISIDHSRQSLSHFDNITDSFHYHSVAGLGMTVCPWSCPLISSSSPAGLQLNLHTICIYCIVAMKGQYVVIRLLKADQTTFLYRNDQQYHWQNLYPSDPQCNNHTINCTRRKWMCINNNKYFLNLWSQSH